MVHWALKKKKILSLHFSDISLLALITQQFALKYLSRTLAGEIEKKKTCIKGDHKKYRKERKKSFNS